MPEERTKLRRELGLWALIVYGIGDILGAGIYALVGKVAGAAGGAAWAAFGLAMFVAAFTALTYAELVARQPRSGGEARFCETGYRRGWAGLLVGWLVLCSGLVSLAAVTRAFAGYGRTLVGGAPEWALILALLAALGAINFRGIRLSSTANIVCTIVEAAGLLFVLAVGVAYLLGDVGTGSAAAASPADGGAASASTWLGVAQGGALAFFAFIGFEDMVNVAEEVKKPRRHFPIAILTALAVTGTVYMIIVYVATAVVPPAQLAEGEAPLLQVVETAAPAAPGWLFTAVALFAVANTGLINFIMASRLIYGMSEQKLLPGALSAVHPTHRTPHRAIVLVMLAAGALALSGTLSYLAATTSVLLLSIFAAVNGALLAMKWRERKQPRRNRRPFTVPWPIPAVGVALSLGLMAFVEGASLGAAAALLGTGIAIVLLHRIFGPTRDRPA